jgi:wobble nucleotide-excising tRNase
VSSWVSGMEVETAQRQKLHDLIIGEQGVALSRSLMTEIDKVEAHNKALNSKGELIPKRLRGDLSPEKFANLAAVADLVAAIETSIRGLAASREADSVARRDVIPELALPSIDVEAVDKVLRLALENVEQVAVAQVQAHLKMLGAGAEAWVEEGGVRAASVQKAEPVEPICPYCAQPLSGSHLIEHYQTYFSDAYRGLKSEIGSLGKSLAATHTGEAVAAFERSVRVTVQETDFWKRFTDVPTIEVDTAAIVRAWHSAIDPILTMLRAKFVAPLEPLSLGRATLDAVANFHFKVEAVADLRLRIQEANRAIALVKERASASNVSVLERDAQGLALVKARYSPEGDELARKFLAEKAAKSATEKRRDAARTALEAYRMQVFPAYQGKINDYLRRLNAGFRLDSVAPVNSRVGSSASYNVIVNDTSVPLVATEPGGPSFRTTLSAGDRNALALAFFFAAIEIDPRASQKVVVFDDPMTSLDEHRSVATVREVLKLRASVNQVVVLSHSKSFLCSIWNDTGRNDPRSSMKVERDANDTSTLSAWDVTKDLITEHDKRAELVQRHISSPVGVDPRSVATALRPMLEAFLRVAYPEWFPPGTLIGPFLHRARAALATPEQKLKPTDLAELSELTDYGNQFHHDTNPSYQTQSINDGELTDHARRIISFTRRG